MVEVLLPNQPAAALEIGNGALKLCRDLGYRAREAELLRLVAAALVGHEPDQAEALVREGLALAQALELRPAEAHALRVLGDIQVMRGHADAADQTFGRARAIYRELGMHLWLDWTDRSENREPA